MPIFREETPVTIALSLSTHSIQSGAHCSLFLVYFETVDRRKTSTRHQGASPDLELFLFSNCGDGLSSTCREAVAPSENGRAAPRDAQGATGLPSLRLRCGWHLRCGRRLLRPALRAARRRRPHGGPGGCARRISRGGRFNVGPSYCARRGVGRQVGPTAAQVCRRWPDTLRRPGFPWRLLALRCDRCVPGPPPASTTRPTALLAFPPPELAAVSHLRPDLNAHRPA